MSTHRSSACPRVRRFPIRSCQISCPLVSLTVSPHVSSSTSPLVQSFACLFVPPVCPPAGPFVLPLVHLPVCLPIRLSPTRPYVHPYICSPARSTRSAFPFVCPPLLSTRSFIVPACSSFSLHWLPSFVTLLPSISTDGNEGIAYHFCHKRASPLVQNQSPNLQEHREMMRWDDGWRVVNLVPV